MYDHFVIDRLIDLWLTEDIGACDLTAQTMIEPDELGSFCMNAREAMIVSGIEVAARIFKRYDPSLEVRVRTKEGDRVEKGTILLDVKGAARSVLTTERTALNIAQRMSGIANETACYVAAIAGTKARLIDTRKTTPGLRMLEKHAVTCGGGLNHRIGLDKKIGPDNRPYLQCELRLPPELFYRAQKGFISSPNRRLVACMTSSLLYA